MRRSSNILKFLDSNYISTIFQRNGTPDKEEKKESNENEATHVDNHSLLFGSQALSKEFVKSVYI